MMRSFEAPEITKLIIGDPDRQPARFIKRPKKKSKQKSYNSFRRYYWSTQYWAIWWNVDCRYPHKRKNKLWE